MDFGFPLSSPFTIVVVVIIIIRPGEYLQRCQIFIDSFMEFEYRDSCFGKVKNVFGILSHSQIERNFNDHHRWFITMHRKLIEWKLKFAKKFIDINKKKFSIVVVDVVEFLAIGNLWVARFFLCFDQMKKV